MGKNVCTSESGSERPIGLPYLFVIIEIKWETGDYVELALATWCTKRAPAECGRCLMVNMWQDGVCCTEVLASFFRPLLLHFQHEW